MVSLLGVGDNTVDRYVEKGIMYPGGNTVNVAVHASRLGHRSAYLGCLARDKAGTLIFDALKAEQVDVSRIRRRDGENAFCDIHLVDGDRQFGDYSEGVCGQLKITASDLVFVSTFDLVHTSVYSFMDPYLPQLQSTAKFLAYDFSSEWDRESLARTLPFLDFALISNPVNDARDNADLLEWCIQQGPELVMATSGSQGAAVHDGKRIHYQPILPIEDLVDTLGAGDAFAARFLTAHLDGVTIPTALENAARYAAENCRHFGAFGHGISYII